MTKTLGSAALQLYAGVAAMFFPIENQPGLIADLESDPFVGHALSSATCELYHRYGMYLAPLTAALTTLKHCQFGHCCPIGEYDRGDEAGESRDGLGAGTESSSEKGYGEVKDPKKVQPGVPALPPERQSKKKDFSSSFGWPRSHFAPPPPPRSACQYFSSSGGGPSGFPAGTPRRTNKLGPVGHWSLSCGRGARVSPTNEESRDRPR